jgi:1,2-dihydroxy-3-keto-5-methylthiopentene dioxygenase
MKAHWLDANEHELEAIPPSRLGDEGVYYERLPLSASEHQQPLDTLKSKRGYIEQDEVELRPHTPNLDGICAKFLPEHFHDEDEVRFVLEGEGVFDIRSRDDRWMRVTVEAGDLIVVPERRHHRFFLTETKNIRCVRLFKDKTGWTPHYRA